MLETAVLDIPAKPKTKDAKSRSKKQSRNALYGYLFLLIATISGWLLSDQELVNPNEGFGYWLGIVGGSLMLLLVFYPAGKKSSLLRRMGLVKHWFRIHMIFGLVGPLLILYHCNFSVDAINSKVALYSMLAVTLSGLIGRYFYVRIHRGLYGKRANVEELREEISDSVQNSRGLAAILPNFIAELQKLSDKLIGDEYTRAVSMRHSLSWVYKYYFVRIRLYFLINRELRARSAGSQAFENNAKSLRKTANAYATQQARMMRQVAQLSFYERLFSLWHIFHMPLFLLLIISALVHVLAVHMY